MAHGWEYRAGSTLIVLLPDLRSFILPTDYELILLNIRADALFLICDRGTSVPVWEWYPNNIEGQMRVFRLPEVGDRSVTGVLRHAIVTEGDKE